MLEKPDCELCMKIKKAKNKPIKCGECIPYLMPENEVPFQIFWKVRNQHIMGPTLPIDIKVDVVRSEIERYFKSETDQDYCFDLVYKAYAKYAQKILQDYERLKDR